MKEIELFLEHLYDNDNTPGSIANYRFALAHFMAWFCRETGQPAEAARVTPLDIRQYRDHLKALYKPGTINKKLNYLSAFFRWAVEEGYSPTVPTGRVKRVTEVPRAPRWLTRAETHRMLRELAQAVQLAQLRKLKYSYELAIRTQAIVIVILNTGLRVSELCDLRPSDVTMKDKSGLVVVRWGKGSKRREIPLNSDARRAVRSWLKIRCSESDYLFCSPGGRLSRQLVQFHLAEMGRELGVKLTPHVLRHTFGKTLADSGVSLDRIAKLMGHTDVSTTAIYTMPSLADLEREVNKISWED